MSTVLLPSGVNRIADNKYIMILSCLFCTKSLDASNKNLFLSRYIITRLFLGKRCRLAFIYTVVYLF